MLLTSQFNPPKRDPETEVKKWTVVIKEALIYNGFSKDIAERIAYSGARNIYITSKREPIVLPISLHLVPKESDWAVVSQNGKDLLFVNDDYNLVLTEARTLAKRNKLKLVLHGQDGWAKDSESFQVNRPFFSEN